MLAQLKARGGASDHNWGLVAYVDQLSDHFCAVLVDGIRHALIAVNEPIV